MESILQKEINFTWAEQPSTLPLELSSEHPLPTDWNIERSEPSIAFTVHFLPMAYGFLMDYSRSMNVTIGEKHH